MNSPAHPLLRSLAALALSGLFIVSQQVSAFPPAPPHEIYGMVRGENGDPIAQASAQIILETSGGAQVVGSISPNLEPGINYRLNVPMDAGNTGDPYLANALTPTTPFFISVLIGTTTYLPIEMTGDFSQLGEPGKSTRINLTLGVDSDGDGLPDSWEELVISQLGGGLTLADITPGGDSDGDGLTNLAEYLAGTYAFDARDTFAVVLNEMRSDSAVLEFLAIRGRYYEIQRSEDNLSWASVPFRIGTGSSNLQEGYQADDITIMVVEVPHGSEESSTYYYRAVVK